MNLPDIDDLLAIRGKALPASPVWLDHKSRAGEMKARLPLEINGATGQAEIEVTVRTADPTYIVIVMLASRACIARLCIGNGHRNKITGETTEEPHFHRWSANRHLTARPRETLPYVELLPVGITARDAAFAWFLHETGIESPAWLPVKWPAQGGFL